MDADAAKVPNFYAKPNLLRIIGQGLGGGVIVLFMALMFLILLGIDGLLLWRLLILNSRAKNAKGVSELARHNSKGLDDEREQMFLESKISAEENMTQPFEPMYIERKTK